jgi:hypothetical protein
MDLETFITNHKHFCSIIFPVFVTMFHAVARGICVMGTVSLI